MRGTIIPVFDLALKAGSARLPITGRSIIVVAEVQEKGYSNHPEAMKAFSAYLRRAEAFERKQRFGR